MERKRASSESSSDKNHSSKENVEESSRRTKSFKGKIYKRIQAFKDPSKNSVNADSSQYQHGNVYSRRTSEYTRQETPRKLEAEMPSSTKSQEKKRSSKKNAEITSRQTDSSKLDKKVLRSSSSSKNLVSAQSSLNQHSHLFYPPNTEDTGRKTARRKMETKNKLPSTLKSQTKQPSCKKKVEKTSTKVESLPFNKKLLPSSSSSESSENLVDANSSLNQHGRLSSRPTSELKKVPGKMETKIKLPSSSKSQTKSSSKKSVKKTSTKTESPQIKKRILPSSSSSESFENSMNSNPYDNHHDHLHIHRTSKENICKEVPIKPGMQSKSPCSKALVKPHSSKKNVVKISRQTEHQKGDKKVLFKDGSSESSVNANSSLVQREHAYSRTKLIKKHSTKKNEKSQRNKSSEGKTFKETDSSKMNSPDTLMNNGILQIKPNRIHSGATESDSLKKAPSSSIKISSKKKMAKDNNTTSDSKDDLYIDVDKIETKDTLLNADKSLNESPSSRTLPDSSVQTVHNMPDANKSVQKFHSSGPLSDDSVHTVSSPIDMQDAEKFLKNSLRSGTLVQSSDSAKFKKSPFLFWNSEAKESIIQSNDAEHKKDDTEVDDDAYIKNDLKQSFKEKLDKEWNKYRAVQIQRDMKEEQKCKTVNSEPGYSSRHSERNDDCIPSKHSENDQKNKNADTKFKNGTSRPKTPCIHRLKKLDNKKEESGSRITEAEPGCSSSFKNERKDAFQAMQSSRHSEDNEKHQKNYLEVNDDICAQNDSKQLPKEKKELGKSRILKIQLDNKNEQSETNVEDAVPGCSLSLHNERKDALQSNQPSRHPEDSQKHQKNDTEDNDNSAQNSPKVKNVKKGFGNHKNVYTKRPKFKKAKQF